MGGLMKIFYYDNWSLSDAEGNPQRLFLFPDDVVKSIKNASTTVRGSSRKNHFGIPIMVNSDKFFNDTEYNSNINIIKHAFSSAPAWLFREMALLSSGLGITEDMLSYAPKTYQYINDCYNDFVKKYNRIPDLVCA